MAQTALIAAFIAGLLGGLHCAAMCGAFVAATATPAVAGCRPLLRRRTLVARQLAGHAGRLFTYAVLGGALGAGGGAAFALALGPAQRVLYVVANLALIALALSMTHRALRAAPLAERAGLRLFRHVAPAATRFAARAPVLGPLALGALWGLTPCALVYGLLPVALLSGSAGNGAAIMLAFGLGTVPNLLAAQWVVARARRPAASSRWRFAAAIVVAAFGAIGVYRGLLVPDAFASGVYCIVPFGTHGTLAPIPP
ncbi:MAG: sulfite exporter TauE/SafE family protein [Casimicrobiaceae bacterium]